MHKREHLGRYIFLGAFFCVICLFFIARLVSIQIAGQDYYTETSGEKTYTRTEIIQAQRGNIYDANGTALVSNKFSYNLYLDAGSLPTGAEERNAILLTIVKTARENGAEEAFSMPENPFSKKEDIVTLDGDFMETVYGRRLTKLLTDLNFPPEDDGTWEEENLSDAYDALRLRYGIVDGDGKALYNKEDAALLFALRLDMELHNFSAAEPYTILTDISVELISQILEGSTRGVRVSSEAERVYHFPGVASHILGRVGRITAENAEYYEELGYSMDAIVGVEGAEKAFEEYLHGVDGELTIIEDGYGNILEQYVSREPVAGQHVYLTIDIELQQAAEKALADNIAMIAENGASSGTTLSGEDADAGALTAIDAKTGAVLALASYPTYDLSTFSETYGDLVQDEKAPLFNRALEGTYAPGSTFKPGVAAAALQEGIITPQTQIQDLGQYTYYTDYQPRCWIYTPRYGMRTHGYVNVSEAIQVSCNYFFYEVGRQLTITKIDEYCEKYGLGQPTGIELSEKTGVLAGPAYREENGKIWYDGDTLQAAIGQSDHLFTPLQLSVYIATLLDGGDRMGAHILKETRDYLGNVLYEAQPEVIDSVQLDDIVVETVQNAMKDVTENGSAARVFVNYPISVGGKTGTAQVSEDSSDNATFIAFAPFDDPQIVATCVIEHGANGTDAGFAIRDLFNSYFFPESSDPGAGE